MQKINGGALCHSMNATQWVRDPTMNSSDLPFETLIKPCVSEVRHLGIQCRRGCSGIPSYGFHKNLTVSTKPAKKLVQMQIPTQFACPNRSSCRAGPAAGRAMPLTYLHVHQIISYKTIGNQWRSTNAPERPPRPLITVSAHEGGGGATCTGHSQKLPCHDPQIIQAV